MKSPITFFLLFFLSTVFAQELLPDQNTLLLLHFDEGSVGVGNISPLSQKNISYVDGFHQKAILLKAGSHLEFSNAYLNEEVGTIEFWIKPNWDLATEASYILEFGGCGGILIFRNFQTFRTIFNRFACNDLPEKGTNSLALSSWNPDEWHHIAITWGAGSIETYLDGAIENTEPYNFIRPTINDASFWLGNRNEEQATNAAIDELRISDIKRSAAEIGASYLAGREITELAPIKMEITREGTFPKIIDTLSLLETWWQDIFIEGTTENGVVTMPANSLMWNSTNPQVANIISFNDQYKVEAYSPGITRVTARYNDLRVHFIVKVNAPTLPVEYEDRELYNAKMDDCYVKEMPVVIIRYMPTQDGERFDNLVGGDIKEAIPLAELKERITKFDHRILFMLTEGSRFRGYKNPDAIPYLGYKVVDVINVYEPIPAGFPRNNEINTHYPDYNQIINRFNGENYVNNLGVKEFWIWGWHSEEIEPVESNMSSSLTGDISNSIRISNDLPIYDHSYVVYNYNSGRSQAEAVHDHGHQLESIYKYVAAQQDGHEELFTQKFVGWSDNERPLGRAGDTHYPPNTTKAYDYLNNTLVESDIEDWTPEGIGEKKLVNADTWGSIVYDWPEENPENIPQKIESQWYIYWMQNMPGWGNQIPYGNNYMTNWWEFTYDWDTAIKNNLGLYSSTKTTIDLLEITTSISASCETNKGSISISANGGIPPYEGTGVFENLEVGNYSWMVSDSRGCSQRIDFSIEEDCSGISVTTTAIHEIQGQKIAIYPNPVAKQLIISQENHLTLVYELYSIDGNLLYTTRTADPFVQIDVSELPISTYILKITDSASQQFFIEKIIKN